MDSTFYSKYFLSPIMSIESDLQKQRETEISKDMQIEILGLERRVSGLLTKQKNLSLEIRQVITATHLEDIKK